jgi:hypothetical protein
MIVESQHRSLLLVGTGLGVVALIALVAPRVGAVGVGTLLALVVAVTATLLVIRGGDREGGRNDGA